ncbi:MAG: prolipoprotein diacylglyceryl transferase [Cyclobacteriaceae bacterium]
MISAIMWNINPAIFEGFELLRWYGVCWVLGIFLAYRIVLRIYRKEGIPEDQLDHLVTYLMFGIIVGARLGHVLFYDPVHYWHNPIEILPFRIHPEFEYTGFAGLASHGGMIGALLALFLYSRKYQKDYLWLLDRLTIAGAALGGFIRLGNLMNSEIIGIPTDVPWAFVFTRIDQVPRHPAQLYEAVFYFSLFLVLYFFHRSEKIKTLSGFTSGVGISMIFIQRFLIEFLKENQVSFEENIVLNMGQTLSIPMILAGIVLILVSFKTSPGRLPEQAN